jgi:murein DD-endopeptidase MepM/ murein hydrolase activator NlpD
VSLLRLHPFDPRRKSRSVEISTRGGVGLAAVALLAGSATALGLVAAPRIVFDLVHATDSRAVGETARRGAEAFASVGRRALGLSARVAADELFLARVAAVIEVRPPSGFPAEALEKAPATAPSLEMETSEIARRLRVLELFRRTLAALPAAAPGGFRPAAVPSRSPVEPSTAVPISVYGPRESPITREAEFETGLTLASPAGSPVAATAEGTVLQAGPVSRRADATRRRLGTVVVVSHDPRTRTIYGHLAGLVVRPGQRVGRGQPLARVGTSGFAPTPRVHYEVQRLENGRWVTRDPRLFILDQDWIGAADLQHQPPPREADELPIGPR